MPKIDDIQDTPNPNAKKFILKEPLTWGISHSYDNAAQAAGDELALALFDIEHVTSVFYVDHWITVTQDGGAVWDDLLRKLAAPIREAPAADERTQRMVGEVATAKSGATSPENETRIRRINELLDEQIRPYLQSDGGDLYVMGLEGNTLSVHYQGACGSCPSSLSGTLTGIESLVKTIEPDIEVIAV